MRTARPAVQLQDAGDLSGNSARVICHISPAVPERNNPNASAGVVPADVAPAGLGRMRSPAIEFDGNAEVPVAVVEVTSASIGAASGPPRKAAAQSTAIRDGSPVKVA